jgi:type IV pilus assembly protein PilX
VKQKSSSQALRVALLARPRRGLSLVFSLLALAALMLAAVALVRSVDSGAMVLGNLGFKQDATSAADRTAEYVRARINGGLFDLEKDNAAEGYYASSQDALDPTGQVTSAAKKLALVDWERNNCAGVAAGTYDTCTRMPSDPVPIIGVNARYLITRLCPATGAPSAANVCARPAASSISQAAARGEVNGATGRPESVVTKPFYRIIVRSVGPRGTVSFTETIVY